MATITFFEKKGCTGNARQKALLIASGHQVLAHDLRDSLWSNAGLLEFLSGLPVAQWFNRSAPAIKSGEIVPEELDEPAALALLRDNPLLIRRPLLQVGEERRVGFDAQSINSWIGLRDVPTDDLEACQQAPIEPQEPHVYYVHSASGGAIRCHVGAVPPHADRCKYG
jgi:nitrogenase-associated protein